MFTRDIATKWLQRISRYPMLLFWSTQIVLAICITSPKRRQFSLMPANKRVLNGPGNTLTTTGKNLFSDEQPFSFFRNTVKRWHKGPWPVRRVPKKLMHECRILYWNSSESYSWGESDAWRPVPVAIRSIGAIVYWLFFKKMFLKLSIGHPIIPT